MENIEVRLKTFLHKLKIRDIKFSDNDTKFSAKSCSKVLPDVKLSKISLSTFNGNMHEWLTFKDLFRASIYDNINLSDGQTLQYFFQP